MVFFFKEILNGKIFCQLERVSCGGRAVKFVLVKRREVMEGGRIVIPGEMEGMGLKPLSRSIGLDYRKWLVDVERK